MKGRGLFDLINKFNYTVITLRKGRIERDTYKRRFRVKTILFTYYTCNSEPFDSFI